VNNITFRRYTDGDDDEILLRVHLLFYNS